MKTFSALVWSFGIVASLSGLAHAVTVNAPAAMGRPNHTPGGNPNYAGFLVLDNSVCAATDSIPQWDTRIVLHDPGHVVLTVSQTGVNRTNPLGGGITYPKSRAFGITPAGTVGSSTGWKEGVGTVGTLTLPINGTLLVTTVLWHDGATGSCVYAFRTTW